MCTELNKGNSFEADKSIQIFGRPIGRNSLKNKKHCELGSMTVLNRIGTPRFGNIFIEFEQTIFKELQTNPKGKYHRRETQWRYSKLNLSNRKLEET